MSIFKQEFTYKLISYYDYCESALLIYKQTVHSVTSQLRERFSCIRNKTVCYKNFK